MERQGLSTNNFNGRQKRAYRDDGQQTRGNQDIQAQTEEYEEQTAERANDDTIFQPTYNLAPGHRGIVLRPVAQKEQNEKDRSRAGVTGQSNDKAGASGQHTLQLQVMKWGLVPSWSRTSRDYATTLKTINCRADSLSTGVGLWAPLRGRKRCVVVANGFYEWRKAGPKDRVPYYIRRRDGLPLLLAGLWDVHKNEKSESEYSFTIITTESNVGLKFLHDRMPVLFDYRSAELQAWLDVKRDAWSAELQALLRPWPHTVDDKDDGAALLVDIVSKDVNKVGNNSASMVIPVASANNKANIANFFQTPATKRKTLDEESVIGDESTKRAKLSSSPSSPALTGCTTTLDNAASVKVAQFASDINKTNIGGTTDANDISS